MHDIDSEKHSGSHNIVDRFFVFLHPPLWLPRCHFYYYFFPLSILPYFISFNAYSPRPLPSVLQVQMLESLSWLKQIESRKKKEEKTKQRKSWNVKRTGEREKRRRKRREKKAWSSLERGEKERDGDDGEEKDSDHADYGWTQQTGKSRGDGRMDEYEDGGEKGGGGRKEKHPTPHIALNNEGFWESGQYASWETEQSLQGKYRYCFWWRSSISLE